MATLSPSGLYAIVDLPDPFGHDPRALARALIAEGRGARLVQLRAKAWTSARRLEVAAQLGEVCADAAVPLVIDDDLAVACAGLPGVSAVHLGQGDLAAHEPSELIATLRRAGVELGISTHAPAEVTAARRWPADLLAYLGFGPVFATSSKANPEPTTGLAGLAAAVAEAPVPVVAIGGLDLPRARACRAHGAAAIAAIGALRAASLRRVEREAMRWAQALAGE